MESNFFLKYCCFTLGIIPCGAWTTWCWRENICCLMNVKPANQWSMGWFIVNRLQGWEEGELFKKHVHCFGRRCHVGPNETASCHSSGLRRSFPQFLVVVPWREAVLGWVANVPLTNSPSASVQSQSDGFKQPASVGSMMFFQRMQCAHAIIQGGSTNCPARPVMKTQ